MWNLEKWCRQSHLPNRNRDTDVEIHACVSKGKKGREELGDSLLLSHQGDQGPSSQSYGFSSSHVWM